ncbi:glycine/D-amino acid oxidase-like deaminating enzyme [Aneurinibacillus soli]|uniref:Cytochrome b6-f complex iron-sulfur subunit n=1 Tax=Aneurinibacillus soli TaxID=1500254 RepID=A0A0U5B0R6_9BACL|nr:FAD-dependent oxidoreductase [Aneurinibacillus soli]PYE57071.1 glycine/D-amino acid oxidase-like deaminating enzyme [Aneurinibacillus soli]BAU29578.1 Cytochrome b6-f complex iron-sulfur subunit [Aneurinibacillus soli]
MAENHSAKAKLPQFPEPYWRDAKGLPSFPKLNYDIKVETAIIGGGISGITTAYLLAKEGVKVALIDAGTLLNGTTGHTTAKITAQHDLIYHELMQTIGKEQAALYYQANTNALHFIKNTVAEHKIECDLTEEDAYIYTNSEEYVSKLHDEFTSYQEIGIDSEYVESIPLPLQTKAAIVMKKQAQFHPVAYLFSLVRFITEAGGAIYENTTAVDIEEGSQPKIITREGHTITCDNAIICSHFPFYDGSGFYFSRMYAERSYVLGIKIKQDYPGGMYLSAENPKRSLRYTMMNGEKLVLLGGESHKAGQGICTFKHYEALQAFGAETFDIKEIPYRWSTQDLITLDKIPYIGRLTSNSPNIFVATGYRKWGMTNGTTAALLLKDLIAQRDNPYAELYSPSRFNADPSVKNFIVQNADVAKHLIIGKLEVVFTKAEDLSNDEGAVVTVNGKRAGAYKDRNGTLHLVDTTCTHMGCEVEWNDGERTWDCPCHGSRFSVDGDVIEGPAEQPLKKVEEE